jgi:nucleoside-diphosphate-sugar epimerase
MARRAFIIGGTGQIGIAIAADLLAAGWEVRIGARGNRTPPARLVAGGASFVPVDRDQPGALARALAGGADAVIDTAAYGPAQGRQLLNIQDDVGALIVISSSSVYRDGEGRTLDEAAHNGFPAFPAPIREDQATVDPGDATYSTRKVALERLLLDAATVPVTILRPAAVHGLGSSHPREWWFVKRMLDRRPVIPLAYQGRSRFHTSSALNIAALTRIALDRPATRLLNIADPQPLTVAEIGALIGKHMGYSGSFANVPTEGYPAPVGGSPWSVQRDFLLDVSAARALGYRPVTDYAGTIGAICDALNRFKGSDDWRRLFPGLAAYPRDLFDYAAEDAALSSGICPAA